MHNVGEKQHTHFLQSAASSTAHSTRGSERTNPLIQGWEQVVSAVEHVQNKFSWSHDKLWQEQENKKSGRSHDRRSGLPRGLALPAASGLLSECADKPRLRANAASPATPLIK